MEKAERVREAVEAKAKRDAETAVRERAWDEAKAKEKDKPPLISDPERRPKEKRERWKRLRQGPRLRLRSRKRRRR